MIQLPQDVNPLVQIGQSLGPFANMLGNLYQQRQQLAMNLEAQQAQRNALQQAYQQNQGQGAQQLFQGLLSAPGGPELAQNLANLSPNFKRQLNLSFGPSGVPGAPQQGVPPVNAAAQRADATQQELGVMQPQAQPQEQAVPQAKIPEKRAVGSEVNLSPENYPQKPQVSIDIPSAEDWLIDPEGSRIRYETSIMEANKYTSEQERRTREKETLTKDIEFDAAQLAKKFPEMSSGKYQGLFEEFVASSAEKYKDMSPQKRAAFMEKDLRNMQILQDNLSKTALQATGTGSVPITFDIDDKFLPRLQQDVKPFIDKKMQKYGEMILAAEGVPPTMVSYLLDPLDDQSKKIIDKIPKAKQPGYSLTDRKRASMFLPRTEEEYQKFDKLNPQLKEKSVPLIKRALEAGEYPFTIREELIRKHGIPDKVAGEYIKSASADIYEDLTDVQKGQMSRVDYTNSEINDDMLRGAKSLSGFLQRFLMRAGSQ